MRKTTSGSSTELPSATRRTASIFVGLGRGHLDLDDRDIGLVCAHLAHELVEIAGLTDNLEALILK